MIREVHHYCSPSVFLSLIKHRELWLTSLTLSNDNAEGIWMLHHWLEKFDDRNSQQRLMKRGAQIAVETVLRQNLALGTCFSEERDLLSQWRGYASDGTGYSITFDKEKLELFSKDVYGNSQLLFAKISYGNDDWREVNAVVKTLHQAFGEDASKYEEVNGNGSMSLSFTPEKYKQQRQSARDLYTVKSEAFREEKEWRLFLFEPPGMVHNLEFRENKGLLSPFTRIKIPAQAILGVTLGPTNPTPKVIVEAALEAHDLKVWTATSAASYRSR